METNFKRCSSHIRRYRAYGKYTKHAHSKSYCQYIRPRPWISNLLGVALKEEEMNESIYVVPTSRGAALLLDDNRARRGETFEIPFMFHSTDIEGAYTYVIERNMNVFHGIERHGDVAFFTVADPDGNLLMICQAEEE